MREAVWVALVLLAAVALGWCATIVTGPQPPTHPTVVVSFER